MTMSAATWTAADQKAHYDEHGYITFPDLLDRSEVAVLRAALDEVLAEADAMPDDVMLTEKFSFTRSETGQRHVRRVFNPTVVHPAFEELVFNPKIVDAVERLIGPDIQLHHAKINLKPPASSQARFEWHQDYPFFPHTNYDLVAVAVHIDESTEENGCLRVVPGSHKLGPQIHKFSADGAFSSQLEDQSVIPDASHWRSVTSPAGGVEMHHCNMLHSSTANRGTKPRSAMIIQYRAADNVQLAPDQAGRPGFGMLIRGTNPYRARLLDGTIVHLPTPIADPTQRDG
jgi:phytanoyl-CoA hydroxylase